MPLGNRSGIRWPYPCAPPHLPFGCTLKRETCALVTKMLPVSFRFVPCGWFRNNNNNNNSKQESWWVFWVAKMSPHKLPNRAKPSWTHWVALATNRLHFTRFRPTADLMFDLLASRRILCIRGISILTMDHHPLLPHCLSFFLVFAARAVATCLISSAVKLQKSKCTAPSCGEQSRWHHPTSTFYRFRPLPLPPVATSLLSGFHKSVLGYCSIFSIPKVIACCSLCFLRWAAFVF